MIVVMVKRVFVLLWVKRNILMEKEEKGGVMWDYLWSTFLIDECNTARSGKLLNSLAHLSGSYTRI